MLLAFRARLYYLVLLSLLYHLEPLADPEGQSHFVLPADRLHRLTLEVRLHRLTLEDLARQLLLERLVLPEDPELAVYW